MTKEIPLDQAATEQAQVLFAQLTTMVRSLVAVAGAIRPALPAELNEGFARGCFVRMEFGLGVGGPIGFGLYATRPDGVSIELVTLDAPRAASAAPFRF